MNAIEFLHKIVRIRKRLLANNSNKKNFLLICKSLKPIEAWLIAYPNASDSAAIKLILTHHDLVLNIIPGAGCPSQNALLNQLSNILNTHNSTTNNEHSRA